MEEKKRIPQSYGTRGMESGMEDQADEDQDDADERWDPDSDMDIDNPKHQDEAFRKPVSISIQNTRIKREIIESELKDQEDHKGAIEHVKGIDMVTEDNSCLKVSDMSIEEPATVKVEPESSTKLPDQPLPGQLKS